MPLVFVHGVNVRRDPYYDNWVEQRNKNFLQFLYAFPPDLQKADVIELGTYLRAAPRTDLIWNPYWGDAGAVFKFGHGALPKGRVESMGEAEDAVALLDVLERAGIKAVPKAGEILSTLGSQTPDPDSDSKPLDNVIDLLWACLPRPLSPEEAEARARLAALATIYSARHPQPEWLRKAPDDDDNEVIRRLMEELAKFAKQIPESDAKGPEEEFGKWSDGLASLRNAARVLGSRLARGPESVIWQWRRAGFHRFAAQFMGDVMTYLVHRGTPKDSGEIVSIVLKKLREAKNNTPDHGRDPLIVIAHSMGGNIVYDILTSYAPDLKIDLFVTVGSQVGLFEELSLFHSSQRWRKNDPPPKLVSRPANVSNWLNVYDPMDPVGFAVERVFAEARDLEYRTGVGLALAHTHYFTYPDFYRRFLPAAQRPRQEFAAMSFISISNGHQAPDKNNPGTHIFIVGVGEYPELNNSGNRFYTDFSGQLSARLTSAVQSAVHMANWFIAHYSNPAAPLRSVEMLLSPTQTYVTPGANPTSHQVDEANIANIEQTFIDWHDRCDARDDNIAVFYFAGHGLYCTTQLLLAQDFLVNQATPLVAAIDYDQTFHEMARCQAKHQFFFIDACRYDNQAINGAGSGPNMQVSKATTLSKSPIIRPMQSRNALQLFATQINCSALGNANQPSRFAAALGEHLTGRGATKNRQGDWLVSHQHLGPYLRRSMDRDNQLLYPQQSGQHQTPDPVIHCPLGESTLHNLTGAPQIPARLGCDPRSANQDADFTLKEIQTGSVISHDSPGSHGGEPWSLNLMANDYTFETVFPNGSFQNKACTVRAETPFTDFNVEVN